MTGLLTPDAIVRIPQENDQKKIREKFGEKFRVYETDHFRVISDTSPRYHRVNTGVLELFYREAHPRFFRRKMKPVLVYLIHDSDDFEQFAIERLHRELADSYGFYSDKEHAIYSRRYVSEDLESGVGTLFHMAIYPMLKADFRKDPPIWFSSGLAMLFERARIIKGKLVYGNPNPWREYELYQAFFLKKKPDLETLLKLSDEDFLEDFNNYNLARSFFLYLQRLGEDKLAKFIELIRAGRPGLLALKLVTGKKNEEVDKEWKESIVKVNYAGYFVYHSREKEDIEILEEAVQRYPDYGNLQYRLALQLSEAGRKKEAITHAELALKDPRFIFPHDAYDVVGWGYQYGKPASAVEAFRSAISYQPWVEDVMEYSYTHLVQILEAGGDKLEAKRVLEELERLKAEDKR